MSSRRGSRRFQIAVLFVAALVVLIIIVGPGPRTIQRSSIPHSDQQKLVHSDHSLSTVMSSHPGSTAPAAVMSSHPGSTAPAAVSRVHEPRLDVVVVEEHQHVLPYWLNFIKKRDTGGVTLIHIDAHDDMAEPQSIMGAAGYHPASARIGNDEFILYSALAGFISQVVWFYPAWTARVGQVSKSGVVKIGTTVKSPHHACSCQVLDTDDADGNCETSKGDSIESADCNFSVEIKYLQAVLRPDSHLLVDWSMVTSWVLDIDEDFFGVENAAAILQAQGGINPDDRTQFSQAASHFCVSNRQSEAAANAMLLKAFTAGEMEVLNALPNGVKLCNGTSLGQARTQLKEANKKCKTKDCTELIQRYGFCVAPEQLEKAKSTPVTLCTGTPGEHITKHKPSTKEINFAAHEIGQLVDGIGTAPSIVTICRSSRDGYVPITDAPKIERAILQTIKNSRWGHLTSIIFDPMLRIRKGMQA